MFGEVQSSEPLAAEWAVDALGAGGDLGAGLAMGQGMRIGAVVCVHGAVFEGVGRFLVEWLGVAGRVVAIREAVPHVDSPVGLAGFEDDRVDHASADGNIFDAAGFDQRDPGFSWVLQQVRVGPVSVGHFGF